MTPKPDVEEAATPVNYTYSIAIPVGTALAQSFSEKKYAGCAVIL